MKQKYWKIWIAWKLKCHGNIHETKLGAMSLERVAKRNFLILIVLFADKVSYMGDILDAQLYLSKRKKDFLYILKQNGRKVSFTLFQNRKIKNKNASL